jgi:hypothetical protein
VVVENVSVEERKPKAPKIHKLDCPHADLVQFWKAPTKADLEYESPYKNYGPTPKYVTFEPGQLNLLPCRSHSL